MRQQGNDSVVELLTECMGTYTELRQTVLGDRIRASVQLSLDGFAAAPDAVGLAGLIRQAWGAFALSA